MLTETQKAAAKEWFVAHMAALFSPPFHIRSDQAAIATALTEYVEALGIYNPIELRDAWEQIRRTHNKQSWPLLADCLKACADTRKMGTRVGAGTNLYEKPYVPPVDPILTDQELASVRQHIVELQTGKKPDGTEFLMAPALLRAAHGMIARHERARQASAYRDDPV